MSPMPRFSDRGRSESQESHNDFPIFKGYEPMDSPRHSCKKLTNSCDLRGLFLTQI
jgi:hypothetical protein